MPAEDDFDARPEQRRLSGIVAKVLGYQHSLPDGRAVRLEELQQQGILSPDDIAFIADHSVTYKPHALSDFHTIDMFHMPTDDGCVFTGPTGPPLTKRTASLDVFQAIVESFLRLPRPQDELLLHIEFSEHAGMAVAPRMICFTLRGASWRQRLPAIRTVAAEFGLRAFQDEEIQGSWTLTLQTVPEVARTAAATVALLSRGCGFAHDANIVYSAGALDALEA